MFINIVLVLVLVIGLCVLSFFLGCLYKQHKSIRDIKKCYKLFPKEDMYIKNAYEDEELNISDIERKMMKKWAKAQRGSVRIANEAYFTSEEFNKYKERVLKIKLP